MFNLIESKRAQLLEEAVCVFSDADWSNWSIDFSELMKIIDAQDLSSQMLNAKRINILGTKQGEAFRFHPLKDCPTSNPRIVLDYCEDLIDSPAIHHLAELCINLGPRQLASADGTRMLVELIARRSASLQKLPPHVDGTACLLFLVLKNTMRGGCLNLFAENNRIPPLVRSHHNGTEFYDENSLHPLAKLKCEAGNGYFIYEGEAAPKRIFHGCDEWWVSEGSSGERVTLRISISRAK